MDKIFDILLTWQFLMMCIGISGITSTVKTVGEYFIKQYNLNKLITAWEELILPNLPVAFGALIGLVAAKYPYPTGIDAVSGRVFFSMAAGMMSGFVYRLLKSLLLSNIKGTEDPNDNLINAMKSKLIKSKDNS